MNIVVTGAAGIMGLAAVHELAVAGHDVTALVDDENLLGAPAQLGVKSLAVNYQNTEAVTKVLGEADALVLVLTLSESMRKDGYSIVSAARDAGVDYIVRLSGYAAAMDAHWRLGKEIGAVDQYVEDCGIPYTILRPSLFMQHFAGMLSVGVKNGEIPLPFGKGGVSYIDAMDVAACIRAVLDNAEGHVERTYALTGPEVYTGDAVAAKFSEILEKDVAYAPIAEADFKEELLAGGQDPWLVEMLISMSRVVSRDMVANATGAVKFLSGQAPKTLEDFIRDNKDLW